jgi:hypothetical protein
MTYVIIPKHTVIQYIRYKNGNPRGVLVAVKIHSGFACGYSLCNKKDRFNKNMALKIALGRADVIDIQSDIPPHEVRKMMPAFLKRCEKYYYKV